MRDQTTAAGNPTSLHCAGPLRCAVMDSRRSYYTRLSTLERVSSNTNMRFPLAADFFPRITCSPDQHAVFKEQADQLSTEATQSAKWAMSFEDGTNGWKLLNSQRDFRETGIRTYTRRCDSRNHYGHRKLQFRCMSKVQMSVKHCLDALYSDNTEGFRSNSRFLIDALDGVVLIALETKTEQQPHHYLGLNWMASRSTGLFSKNRDLCYLRSMGLTVDKNKSKVGYLVTQSVDLKECASLETALGLIRTKMSAVLLFKDNAEFSSANVLWQGSVDLSDNSSSKLANFVHEIFKSIVSNLNKVQEARFMAQQLEGHTIQRSKGGNRRHCFICSKKFSIVRTHVECTVCAESICKDCEDSSRAKAFYSKSCNAPSLASSRQKCVVFCKKCVNDARRERSIQSNERNVEANPSPLLLESKMHPTSADEQDNRSSDADEASNQNSSKSKLAADLNKELNTHKSKRFYRIPLYVGTMSSAGAVPISPLSIQMEHRQQNAQLKADPMEMPDGLDSNEYDVLSETDVYDLQNSMRESSGSLKYAPLHRQGYGDSCDSDMVTRLREISQRAYEAFEVTKRNSNMMSDTSSAPRVSDLSAFKELEKSIAEQADLLNVIGFVSTGRVYMENNGSEQGGVCVSESSSITSEDKRFEVIT
ncbi:hypothetical protein PsorP6_008739 [Peronosclerospora sorghi]|uniref:Uncharacterized protein n=1 Tax=Peronosclerospora sorghi TaxID=230839 RepID=A0ACC0W263_9STRA|nr:hypothetical protein PsorP6_008739 [Peronosclerospora sorghi]